MKITKIPALKEFANKIRLDIIQEIYYAKSGHPGGSLSIADILAVLYQKDMHQAHFMQLFVREDIFQKKI